MHFGQLLPSCENKENIVYHMPIDLSDGVTIQNISLYFYHIWTMLTVKLELDDKPLYLYACRIFTLHLPICVLPAFDA